MRNKGEALLDSEDAIDFLSNNSFWQDFCLVIFGAIVAKLWSLPTANIFQMCSALIWQEKTLKMLQEIYLKNNWYSGKIWISTQLNILAQGMGNQMWTLFFYPFNTVNTYSMQDRTEKWTALGVLTALLEGVYNFTKLRTELKSRIW